jgi:hypothetical protein
MKHLYQVLADQVAAWRADRYACDAFPTISELLAWQTDETTGALRYLRPPQLRALETYWYLRLVRKTPRMGDLYRAFHAEKLYASKRELVDSLGVPAAAWDEVDTELDALFQRIETDDAFVARHRMEAVRETLTLAYPSYILALAMGAGKTVVIGSILATEFAMGLEYPDSGFVENALVFAPPSGKTILGSLRELSDMPYERILPPRLYAQFAPNLKITFTRDGERDVPVVRGSRFNVVVTNAEKIRIQAEATRNGRRKNGVKQLDLLRANVKERENAEVANLRLQTIASLPNLAIFSDEAHHTYGLKMGEELKKVRKTVDYLHANTSLICVVNTTGTPYFEKQPLKDVVIWYGLSEGIRDGILKEVRDGVQAYRFDDSNFDEFVSEVVRDFFRDYADVRLPSGAPAKLAIYFPQTDDLEAARPIIERTLVAQGFDASLVLRNTNEATQAEEDAFNRLNDPAATHRVILLVNKGTEGWNCPSLFACALARKLKSSNNFVLQASTRCLRQIPGNETPARIYISDDNRRTLENQLQETYGESLSALDRSKTERKMVTLTLRKLTVPPLVLRVPVTVVRRKSGVQAAWLESSLHLPKIAASVALERTAFALAHVESGGPALRPRGEAEVVATDDATVSVYAAAVALAERYRLDALRLRGALARLYPAGMVPVAHLAGPDPETLAAQLERLTCDYEQTTEYADVTLALVKKEGWDFDADTGQYTAEATDNGDLVRYLDEVTADPRGYGFHYAPYRFDSKPEREFFVQLLRVLTARETSVEDIYYIGGVTDPKKTDFFVEWMDTGGTPHRYTPDFIIRRRPRPGEVEGQGACLIVEIKQSHNKEAVKAEIAARDEATAKTDEARKALASLRLVDRNLAAGGNTVEYDIIFDDEKLISEKVRAFVEEAAPTPPSATHPRTGAG